MKICVIGNSHVACLKKAWDRMPKLPFELTFFASYASSIVETTTTASGIQPRSEQVKASWVTTSDGRDQIDFAAYDLIWVHGLGYNLNYFAQLLKQLHELGASHALKHEAIVYNNRSSLAILECMPSEVRAKCIVSFRPNRVSQNNESEAFDRALLEQLVAEIQQAHEHLGFKATISQPQNTLQSLQYTRPEFSRGAVGLGKKPPSAGYKDVTEKSAMSHMNAEYGKLLINEMSSLFKQ